MQVNKLVQSLAKQDTKRCFVFFFVMEVWIIWFIHFSTFCNSQLKRVFYEVKWGYHNQMGSNAYSTLLDL